MKIVLVSDLRILVDADGVYHHHCFNDFYRRYAQFGEVSCCVGKKMVDESQLQTIKPADFTFLEDVNSLGSLCKNNNKKLLAREISKADLVIIHGPSVIGNMAAKISRKLNKPILAVVVACVWDGYWNHSLKGKFFAAYGYLAGRRFVAKSQFALYVTQDFLQRRYPTNAPSIGCSDVNISSKIMPNKVYDKSRTKQLKIGTVGSVGVRYKGQEYVIRAMPELQKHGITVDYYLIGSGNQSRLKMIAEKCGVNDNVHFIGIVPHEKIPSMLQNLDVYIQPSLQEGLPRAVVEAMSVGLPVIGSNTGGIPELIDKKWVVKRRSSKAIYEKILRIMNPNVLWEVGNRNLIESRKYEASVLDKKRNDFLQSIVNLVESTKK